MRTLAAGLALTMMLGCKPPAPSSQPPAGASQASTTIPADAKAAVGVAEKLTADGLPAKLIENVEQVIKLTAEYNARAEKITDRQTYIDQSGSLAELENELSLYGQLVDAAESRLTPAQQATLDSKYFVRAKPLIDAKRQHKERMLGLLQ
jgi:hypothetical protein